MQPVMLQLEGGGTTVNPTNLPSGATFEASTRTLRWIPKKGQAGSYIINVALDANGFASKQIKINVAPMSEQSLQAGPPSVYSDEQVGYVFVHGAGETDRCTDTSDLQAYWGDSLDVIAPNWSGPEKTDT